MTNLKTDSPVSRRIATSFLRFLHSVEPSSGVDSESLEVARECLAEVFKIDSSALDNQSNCDSLIDLFSSREAIACCETDSAGISNGASTSAAENSEVLEALLSLGQDTTREQYSNVLQTATDALFEESATEVLAEPPSPVEEPSASTDPAIPTHISESVDIEDIEPVVEEPPAEVNNDIPSTTDQDTQLDMDVEEVLADDPASTSALIPSKSVDDSKLHEDLKLKGKELPLHEKVRYPTDLEEQDLVLIDQNIHLESIASTLDTILIDMKKITTATSNTSFDVNAIRESINSKLKSFSKDLSDLSTSLHSKIRKTSLNQLQSQTFLSDKLDLMNSRFDSIDAKLATITAALLSQSVVIAKKGESNRAVEPKRSTDEPSKKRAEPDSSRKDKGPTDKRSKH